MRSGARTGRRALGAAVAAGALLAGSMVLPGAGAAAAPIDDAVGQGFTVSPADLAYILQQIKIAEAHVATTTSATGPCGSLVGPGPNQLPNVLVSFGLRTVDGSCNNLQVGQANWGAAHQLFPRLATPEFDVAEVVPAAFGGPSANPTSYAQASGSVFDSQPRLVSNLVVDQTSTNPAAVAAAGFPVRTQGNPGVFVCGAVGAPAPPDCVPENTTLFIPNVTTDIGLSPPFNGLFALFGQFFDHGLDKVTNGGSGTVFVPLRADDPLIAGADHVVGNGDDLPANQRFMVLTRATALGPNGSREAKNTDTPFVDQSQTYSSHSSHQVFLREYVLNGLGRPMNTGKLLHSADDGMATWAMVKSQAAVKLGLRLVDTDVNDIPMIAADAYGNFIPGPLRGMPQYVTATGLVEGNTASPVAAPANVIRIGVAFLNDIAHSAAPTAGGPDSNTTAGGSLDTPVPAGTYDNELLDLHFIAGDGRVNENIGLTAIHQVFHSEHNRLVDDIKNTLTNDTSAAGVAALAEWKLATGAAGWNGARLFQAARFVTEMEYQHLVFEEFGRKIQPAINPFEPFAFNQTDVNPAITAEFAHAVYRFGHSMLNETIDRIDESGTRFDIPMLDGFLNPASYTEGPGNTVLTSRQAAGAIIMGMSDQVGNEIDEFVTDTLRNNLLGLPLDLATLNMTRARSEGIPSLNDFRREVFAQTNDGQLTPYANWLEFGLALKHPESLVNFVAAYGTHPSIVAQSTIAGKREAARLIVNPDPIGNGDVPPADAAAFLGSTGAWANNGTNSVTGLDDVDLWMGGLAENTNPFGGLLGTTFNYVFENQLTNLQNGDRFYYLARTPGMNLRAQLEGNSFAELMMRNTTALSLKADPFATADCKFQFANAPGIASAPTGTDVVDDPTTECREDLLLIRLPDNTIRYRSVNAVDPVGINGQAVYNGTTGTDRMWGGNDNDTFLGNEGNDVIEGGSGDDIAIGGEGNDIITDSAGDDIPKGGPGNDAIDGGIGLDILMGGDGDDFTNGGGNANEAFLGAGDDFAIGGQGADAVFGDSGDDWMEGGDQPDLLIGDSSTLFFDDHNIPGHDVTIGQGGDDDYDTEGGDDIMVAGPGVEKNAGASGYDWSIGLNDPQPQDADLNLKIIAGGAPANEVRDRFNEVEALSGWNLNDTLRGDDLAPSTIGGGGFIGCDVLDQDGLDRIVGLDALVPPLTTPAGPIIAASTTNYCMLQGNVWGDGNILLGGAGSDVLEGRGANDIIDGDRYVNVRISVRTNKNDPGSEVGSTDSMSRTARTGTFGPGTAGMTLQQAVFAGIVDPGKLAIVREVVEPFVPAGDCAAVTPLNCDRAVFSGPRADYDLTQVGLAVVVTHARGAGGGAGGGGGVGGGGAVTDTGIDTTYNVEQFQFSDQTIANPFGSGLLRVTTSPAVPSRISVDGFVRNDWGLDWVTVPSGSHSVCFSDVTGFNKPACQTVTVTTGQTTVVNGVFAPLGLLQATVVPSGLPSTIHVDGIARDEYGLFAFIEPGSHTVCWGDVPGFQAPACQTVTVTAGVQSTVEGTFVADANPTPGPFPVVPHGFLRVSTNPAVVARISVDGVRVADWGLTWVKMPAGAHQVCFSDVPGFVTPFCQTVSVTVGNTTSVVGNYVQLGLIQVGVAPAGLPVDVVIDGLPRNQFGAYLFIEAGVHVVCGRPTFGYTTPSCQTVTVTGGAQTNVTIAYVPSV
ncbi:MAG: heme peroxidase [Actinobacteria bacterium]|nr:heme peroxidase [Actinomycetota bacterium]